MRKCSICAHPKVAEIDKFLARDAGSKTECAVRFNVSESSVQRHRSGHLGLTTRKTSGSGRGTRKSVTRKGRFDKPDNATDEPPTPEALKRKAWDLMLTAERIMQTAESDADLRLCLQAHDRTAKSLEQMCRLYGLLGPDVQINVNTTTVNEFAGWPDDKFFALQRFYETLQSGGTIEDGLRAVTEQTGPLALPPGER